MRPDLHVVGFRGNVQTRLRKLAEGVADATLLACAGLKRLGSRIASRRRSPIETMLPAVAQGAIAIEIRGDDDDTARLIAPLNHEATALRVTAERALLARSRRLVPHGRSRVWPTLDGGRCSLPRHGVLVDGAECFEVTRDGTAAHAGSLGTAAADVLLELGAGALLSKDRLMHLLVTRPDTGGAADALDTGLVAARAPRHARADAHDPSDGRDAAARRSAGPDRDEPQRTQGGRAPIPGGRGRACPCSPSGRRRPRSRVRSALPR